MINFQAQGQDFSPENKQNCEIELFRLFQHSPVANPLEQIQQENSESIDISVSIRNDFSNFHLGKKKTDPNVSSKMLELLKIDKIIQNFKQKLGKRAYVFDNQTKAVIQKFVLEKFLNKETQKFTKFSIEGKQIVPIFEQSSLFIKCWQFIRILFLISILWAKPFSWSFQNKEQDQSFFFFYIILIYLSTDILVRINTSIVSKGNIIKERMQILSCYIQNDLIQDFLLCFSIIMIGTTFNDLKQGFNIIYWKFMYMLFDKFFQIK